jgi:hypothetical protein
LHMIGFSGLVRVHIQISVTNSGRAQFPDRRGVTA